MVREKSGRRRRLVRRLAVVAALGWLGVAPGKGIAQEADPAVATHFQLAQYMADAGGYAAAAAQSYGAYVDSARARALAQGTSEVLGYERLYGDLFAHYRQNTSKSTQAMFASFYQSDLGRRVARALAPPANPNAAQEIEAYIAGFEQSVQDPQRIALLQRLDKANLATATALALVVLPTSAVARALDAMRPMSEQMGAKAIANYFEGQRKGKHKEGMAKRMLGRYLYHFRTLSTADLQAYVQFCESSPRNFTAKMQQALTAVLTDASDRLTSRVVEILQAQSYALLQAQAARGLAPASAGNTGNQRNGAAPAAQTVARNPAPQPGKNRAAVQSRSRPMPALSRTPSSEAPNAAPSQP